MKALKVFENINFERKGDPFKSLNIGRRTQRTFKNIEEAAQWAYDFPEEYTNGKIKEWPKDPKFYQKPTYGNIFRLFKEDLDITPLNIVKWFKWNLIIEDVPNYGLVGAKKIYDRLEEIVKNNLTLEESINFEKNEDPFKSLNIGRNRYIKKELLKYEGGINSDWLDNFPELSKILIIKERKNIFDILLFLLRDRDKYNEEIKKEFIEEKDIKTRDNSILKIGKLFDDSKVIYFNRNGFEGFITKREWLK